ncbi:hypothetical protein [Oleiharenicola lentus]|uniref:hypothetical protein n=1 Tax=Oleiharenicola lentus TaxID=2508720 RepID=UPI003F674894
MKNTRLMLTVLLVTGVSLARAQESANPAAPTKPVITTTSSEDPAKLSADTTNLVKSGLPKYNPNPAPVAKPVLPKSNATAEVATDGETLELDKMTITNQRVRPRLTPQVMMTKQGFNEKLAKERLSQFDRNGLNKYTLPLFGYSAAERARDEYDREQNATMRSDVLSLAKAVEVDNPEQAAELRKQANK